MPYRPCLRRGSHLFHATHTEFDDPFTKVVTLCGQGGNLPALPGTHGLEAVTCRRCLNILHKIGEVHTQEPLLYRRHNAYRSYRLLKKR